MPSSANTNLQATESVYFLYVVYFRSQKALGQQRVQGSLAYNSKRSSWHIDYPVEYHTSDNTSDADDEMEGNSNR